MTTTHTPGPWEIFTPADPVQARRVTAVVTCPHCNGTGIPAGYSRKKCHRCNGTGKDQYAPPTVASGFAQQCADAEEWAKESMANARLIAAAPDLLESLKEMVADLLSHASLGLNENEVAMLKRGEAAIAKAEGRQS